MTLSVPRVRHYLQQIELEKLFIEELGWDRHWGQHAVEVDGQRYTLQGLAEKRGVQIFVCQPDAQGKVPDYATRRKIEKDVTKSAYEHLIIFSRCCQIDASVAVGLTPARATRCLPRAPLSPQGSYRRVTHTAARVDQDPTERGRRH